MQARRGESRRLGIAQRDRAQGIYSNKKEGTMTKEELSKLKVGDVLALPEFRHYLQEVMNGEEFSQNQAAFEASKKGARLGRTPLDNLRDKQAWNVEKLPEYFGSVLNKSLIGFSASERDYIYLVGMAAFNRTMQKLQE